MMDGAPLYPGGFHPIRRRFSPDVIDELKPLSRSDHPVRYYYIDFGLSERFAPGAPSLVIGDVGRDAEVPELSSTVPYDGYKADIHALGNLFHKELELVSPGSATACPPRSRLLFVEIPSRRISPRARHAHETAGSCSAAACQRTRLYVSADTELPAPGLLPLASRLQVRACLRARLQ